MEGLGELIYVFRGEKGGKGINLIFSAFGN